MGFLADLLRKLGGGPPSGGSDNGGPPVEPEMISCREALELLFEYLDGELGDVSDQEVAAHFDVCQQCYPRLRFETAFREAVAKAQTNEAAPERVKQRILEVLKAEGFEPE